MARLAALVLKAALVWISMAVIALAKRKTLVARRSIRAARVTLLAFHLLVQARERVAGLVVIELPGGVFPVDEIMALQTILTESAFVEIFVTSYASLRDPEEGLAQILHLDAGALGCGNLFREVALVARQSGVFAFQQVACFLVIELVRARIPLDQREIRAVVIGVASSALLARAGRNVIRAVQSAFRSNPRTNVGVTADAFELRLTTPNLVAICTVHCTVEELMLTGKWPWGNLGGSGPSGPAQHY